MKKTGIKYFILFLLAILPNVSCQKQNEKPVNRLLGSWEYEEVIEERDFESGNSYEVDYKLSYTFNPDLSGKAITTFTYSELDPIMREVNFTYSTEKELLFLIIKGDTIAGNYAISDNKLSINDGREILIFTKVE